jgi:glycosyltransferase involved in cell wall biosynthesis
MSAPKISVVVRCCNEAKHIGRLLYGIFEQTEKNLEVVIVDSGSSDDTIEVAQSFPVTTICTIAPEEFSFGHALNVGCEKANGEILVFASAHVYPIHQEWLANLTRPFDNPKVALTYGRQTVDEYSKYSEKRILSKWFPEHSILVQRNPFCNNANAAIRKSLWEQFPYDESLTGLEDLDWAKRIIGQGYHLSYVADAEIVHIHEETFRAIFNRYYRESIVFFNIFPEQVFRIRDFLCLWLLNTGSDYIHALQEGVLAKHITQIPYFRLMQFWGTYRGSVQRDPISAALRQRFYYPTQLDYDHKSKHSRAWTPDRARKINYEAKGYAR